MSVSVDASEHFMPPPAEPRVMLVEDEPRLRQFMQDELPRMGFKFHCHASAEEAKRQVQRSLEADKSDPGFDIAILDLNLPVMNGLDFLRLLRTLVQPPSFPAIILTGFGDLEAAQRAIDLGVTSFLTKPCRLEELEKALSKAKRELMEAWQSSLGSVRSVSTKTGGSPSTSHEGQENETDNKDAGTLAFMQREAIFKAIEECQGNRSAAAKKLGISRRTLYNKIAEYESDGFEVP